MNPTYALLSIVIPETLEPPALAKWRALQSESKTRITPSTGVETLSENSWLIPLASGLLFLCESVVLAKNSGFQCKVVFLETAPLIVSSPSP